MQKDSLGLVCSPADLRYVEEIVIGARTSFYKGMSILEPARREAMYAIYAFCRLVDDIADGDTNIQNPKEGLALWRERISGLYEGKAQNQLDRVLSAAIMRFGLLKEDFIAVIDGMEMDCETPIIAPLEADLDLYCDRVASAVGRLSVRIFGIEEEKGKKLAYHLGRALQLTNILRDLAEDAERGRLYLPKELLARFSVSENPQEITYYRGLEDLCHVLAARAWDNFNAADEIMAELPSHTVKAPAMMAASYKLILKALIKRGWRFPEKEIHISSIWKKIILLLTYIRN